MELLATNQPWNLISFMAIPVILAETIAVTELFLLFGRKYDTQLGAVNRVAGIIIGLYFVPIFVYLMINAFIPLTTSGGWRGPSDFIAVTFYLLGVVPLLGMALLELGIIAKNRSAEGKLKLQASLVALFLVVAHVAMIFGMLSPAVFGAGTMAM